MGLRCILSKILCIFWILIIFTTFIIEIPARLTSYIKLLNMKKAQLPAVVIWNRNKEKYLNSKHFVFIIKINTYGSNLSLNKRIYGTASVLYIRYNNQTLTATIHQWLMWRSAYRSNRRVKRTAATICTKHNQVQNHKCSSSTQKYLHM